MTALRRSRHWTQALGRGTVGVGCGVGFLFLLVGCGAKQVVLTPDYANEYYQAAELSRPDVEVVAAQDLRNVDPERVGTAKVGMFNAEVPCLLSVPVTVFTTRSINAILGANPAAENLCPVTVAIEALTLQEKKGLFGESAVSDCRLRFSFPLSDDSTSVTVVHSENEVKSVIDVTSSFDDLLYQTFVDCTEQFLSGSYDAATSRLLVGRSEARSRPVEIVSLPRATEPTLSEDPADGSWRRIDFYYHHFTSDEMRDAYSAAFGMSYMQGGRVTPRLDAGLETGTLMAWGTPVERATSSWKVDSANLFSLMIPIQATLFYPGHRGREGTFRPYGGVGVGGVLGLEVMSADLSDALGMVEVRNSVFRSLWTGGFTLGAELGRNAANPFLELRWLFSGRSRVSEGLSDEEKADRAATLYDALIRPDGRFTGGQLRLGFRW